jgi:predicted metal-dependent phosphoesterase TrpH
MDGVYVIGLFVTVVVVSRRFDAVIAEIRELGGVAVLPHPYRGRDSDPQRIGAVDLVEVFNARSSDEANASALADAKRLGVGQLAGADIHTAWELLRNGTLVRLEGSGPLRDRLAAAPRGLSTLATPRALRRYSQVVKRIRARIGLGGHA